MKLSIRTFWITLLAIAAVAVSGWAGTFVSFNGRFHITFPDNWHQVDYNTVDSYLFQGDASAETYNYEVVLADSASEPFFSGPYVILTVDTRGLMTDTQVDSILNDMANSFAGTVQYKPLDDFLTNLPSQVVTYDRNLRLVAICNETPGGASERSNAIFVRFYDRGSVTFFFFAPNESFASDVKVMDAMIRSFSTEDIDDATPQETLKIADLENRDDTADEGGSAVPLYLWIGLGVIVVAAVALRLFR